MSDKLIMANIPVEFEARNPYPKYTRLRAGDCYKLTIEVSEEDWNLLKTMPPNALLRCWMVFSDGDAPETKTVKEEKPKGQWGKYWSELFKAGLSNIPDLVYCLNMTVPAKPEEVKNALKEMLDAESLTFVAPSQFEVWCDGYNLQSVITLSRQAEVKTAEKESK